MLRATSAIALVAFVERAHALRATGIFRDEASTWLFTTLDLRALVGTIVADDGNPPGYYIAVWLWARLVGRGEVALEALSLVAGIALVVACIRLTESIAGRTAACFGGLFVATNFFAVLEAVDARAYTFAALGFTIVCAAVWRIVRDGGSPSRVVVLGVAIAVTSYVHYTGALAAASLVLACLAYTSFGRARASLAAGLALGGVLFAPWIPSYLVQRNLGYRLFVPIRLDELGEWSVHEVLPLVGPETLALAIVGVVVVLRLRSRSVDATARTPSCRFVDAMTLGAMAVIAGEPLLHLRGSRYLFVIEPALCLVLGSSVEVARGWIVARIRASRLRSGAMAVATASALGALVSLGIGTYQATGYAKSAVPAALAVLGRRDAQVVVLAPDYLAPTVYVYRKLHGGPARMETYAFANDDRPEWQRFTAWLDAWNQPHLVARYSEKILRRAGDRPIYVLREPNASDRPSVRFASKTLALEAAFVRAGRTRRTIFEGHGLYESAVLDVFTKPPTTTSCSCAVRKPKC